MRPAPSLCECRVTKSTDVKPIPTDILKTQVGFPLRKQSAHTVDLGSCVGPAHREAREQGPEPDLGPEVMSQAVWAGHLAFWAGCSQLQDGLTPTPRLHGVHFMKE